MQTIEHYLSTIFIFFTTNWIAAAILGIVVLVAVVKKPVELFKVTALIALFVGVLYIMIYLEKSMFSGVSSGRKAYDLETRAGDNE